MFKKALTGSRSGRRVFCVLIRSLKLLLFRIRLLYTLGRTGFGWGHALKTVCGAFPLSSEEHEMLDKIQEEVANEHR